MTALSSPALRPWLSLLEILILLGLVPVLVLFQPDGHLFRRAALLGGCLYVVLRLRRHISWIFLFGRPPGGWWRGPLLRGALVLILALAYAFLCEPEHFLDLPRNRPLLWLIILILYPLLSVLPQEIIFRVWFFEAHKPLWRLPLLPLPVSALFFGWAHIIFAGWFAVAATTLGGLLLAWNYHTHRASPGAIWPLCLEHSLYGLTMFTVGLGRHFFLSR
ncbi:MAG: CPBP family intramembrane metalloprotease [Desulfovibrio sp.]|jgi:membrane protease YdiL (CAAX protease family)|nr:CPBP family intramembrane metalloprotease [Desulfovibrio sp.]